MRQHSGCFSNGAVYGSSIQEKTNHAGTGLPNWEGSGIMGKFWKYTALKAPKAIRSVGIEALVKRRAY